jgi:hypothetical protein
MTKQQIKEFALAALDDEHGLNQKSWDNLRPALESNGLSDISVCVIEFQKRFFLEEGEAERLANI